MKVDSKNINYKKILLFFIILLILRFLAAIFLWEPLSGSFYGAIKANNIRLMELELCISPVLANSISVPPGEKIGWKPLIYAIQCDNADAVKVLIKYGANVNEAKPHPFAASALYIATMENKKDIVKILLESGANSNIDIRSPIFFPVWKNDIETIRLFIKHGADLNVQDDDGVTPLSYAADEDMVRILLENGADPSIRDNDNKTVKDYLIEERIKANDKEKIRIDKMIKLIEKYEKPQKK